MATRSSPEEFEVREVQTLDELRQVNDVMWLANHYPYNPVFYLRHPITGHTPEDWDRSKESDTVQLWTSHQANPASRWIMAVESATGKVVAGMQWYFWQTNPFPNGPKPLEIPGWPKGSEVSEYANRLFTTIFTPQMLWCQRPHSGINSTGVHPDYRRRGIGLLLMKWGLKRTDELGLESFAEGSPEGSLLYEVAGYRLLMRQSIDMSKPNPSPMWVRLMHEFPPSFPVSLLWRPPHGQWTDKTPGGPWHFEYE